MVVYILTFINSLLFVFFASKNIGKKRILFIILSSIAIFIPCLIAGMRGLNVGSDTSGYQYNFFLYASKSSGLLNFFRWTGSSEFFYLIVTYFTNRIFHSFSATLFFNQLLVILPIYYVLVKNAKNNSEILIGMFIYYTYFYNLSLNMSRQSIALSFCILAFYFYEKTELKKCFFSTITAILFHNSAAIVFPILLLASIMKKNNKLSSLVTIFSVIGFSLVSVYFYDIIYWLNSHSIIKYSYFVDYYVGNAGVSKITFFFTIALILNNLFYKEKIKLITNNYSFYNLILIILLLSSYTTTIIIHSDRIFYYFMFPYIFLILPRISSYLERKENKIFANILIICLFSFYWYYTIVYKNFNMTLPYVFR